MPPQTPARAYRDDTGNIVVPVGLLLTAYRAGIGEILHYDAAGRRTLRAKILELWITGKVDGKLLVTPWAVWR